MSQRLPAVVVAVLVSLGVAQFAWAADQGPRDYWVEPMRRVHAKFDGRKGAFAQFGDSITVTMAFWTPLKYRRNNAPAEMVKAFELVSKRLRQECWRNWKGPQYGSQGSMTIRWAHKNIDAWLAKLDPEVAVIMFGTNDLHSLGVEEHTTKLREVIGKCLANGTVVILTTIPPRHRREDKCRQFVEAQRGVARELKVPLIDFYGEIMKRRPDDWDGALEKFKDYKGYDVPTLLARDGVHPSHPKQYRDDYSEEGLRHCGFVLRNYLTLMKYAEVVRTVIRGEAPRAAPVTQPGTPGPRRRPPVQPWFPKAPPLPPPAGQVIKVATVDQLFQAAEQVRPGGTILIADGHYRMPRSLTIGTDKVTLRGQSGRRERVILDGAKSRHHRMIAVTGCSDVTIADLTIQNVRQNGYKIDSNTGVHRVTLYNCVGHNVWQRHVKGVPGQVKNGRRVPAAGCRIQYCLFYNDRPKRLDDEPYEKAHPSRFRGNYVGGIDVMNVKDWVISDNVFIGIRGATGEARGAIFVWNGSQDTVIERNILIDCDTGICLGNSHRAGEWLNAMHCTRFIVRNNFVTRCPENNILANYTRDCLIVNNTVHDPTSRMGRLLRVVHDNDGLRAFNNIFSGPRIVVDKHTGKIEIRNNLIRAVPDYFADAKAGDLHLTARAVDAIDKAVAAGEVTEDIDRRPRGDRPDLGADELAAH